MNKGLISVLKTIQAEHGIDMETLIELVEETVQSAAKKAVNASRDVVVKVDRTTGDFHCLAKLLIAKTVTDSSSEVSLRDVQARFPEKNYTDANIGEEVEWEVTPADFGRIAAQNMKQFFWQKVRAIERRNTSEAYRDHVGSLMTATVHSTERGDVIVTVDDNHTEGVLRREDRIPGERYEAGDIVTALLYEINTDRPGPSLCMTRTSTDFIVRLFEREVTEIREHLVEIKAIAREPGFRTKIAVNSNDPRVDPQGACIGAHGGRVKMIVRELAGEKIDVVQWSPDIKVFVENALKPARLTSIVVDEARRNVTVQVPEDQLSLTIGKKGLNAKLASRLTGWKLDVQKQEVVEEKSAEEVFADQKRNAIDSLAKALDTTADVAESLVNNGFISVEMVKDAELGDLAALEGLDEATAALIKAKAAEC